MGVLVMVLGASGSGKSTSLMKLADKQVDVFCATSKRLPFRTPLETHTNAGYREIYEALKAYISRVISGNIADPTIGKALAIICALNEDIDEFCARLS